jgi:hypothetical protein
MILLNLLFGHLVSDFILQPDQLIVWKNKSWVGVLVHALIHFGMEFLLFLTFVSNFQVVLAVAIVAVFHFLIDIMKIRIEKKKKSYLLLFFIDQGLHLICLIFASLFIAKSVDHNWSYHLFFNFSAFGIIFIYLISAIIVTFGLYIIKLKFKFKKNDSVQYKPHWFSIIQRLIALTLVFAIYLAVTAFLR